MADPRPPGSTDSTDPTDPDGTAASAADPEALLAVARELAVQAAALLLDALPRTRLSVDHKTTATDLVTEMDRASEALIVAGLRRARPDDGIVGEEGATHGGTSGVRWIVDPLDGTTNYFYGHPGFAVSIAAELVSGDPTARGAPVAAVVVDPVHEDVFSATRGGGARRNGRLVRCSTVTDLGQALVATGFGYAAERRAHQAEVLTEVLPRVRDIRRVGSAALDLCSVACGRVDAYYERGLAHWDYAAGVLIAAEAGAVVSGPGGGAPSSDLVVAAPAALFPPLAELLRSAGADRD